MNETIEFTIYGNQENPDGNPIPYHRTTRGSYWNAGSKRYAAWKDYVVLASGRDYVFNKATMKLDKPIRLPDKHRARMTLKMYFCDNTHADPDNIFKGIADALFVNDKKVSMNVDFDVVPGKPGRVDVVIDIFPQGII